MHAVQQQLCLTGPRLASFTRDSTPKRNCFSSRRAQAGHPKQPHIRGCWLSALDLALAFGSGHWIDGRVWVRDPGYRTRDKAEHPKTVGGHLPYKPTTNKTNQQSQKHQNLRNGRRLQLKAEAQVLASAPMCLSKRKCYASIGDMVLAHLYSFLCAPRVIMQNNNITSCRGTGASPLRQGTARFGGRTLDGDGIKSCKRNKMRQDK